LLLDGSEILQLFIPWSWMTRLTNVHTFAHNIGDSRLVGCLLEITNSPDQALPAQIGEPTSLCMLTLFTQVPDVKGLSPLYGFVAQKYNIRLSHPICEVQLFNKDQINQRAVVLLDSGNSTLDRLRTDSSSTVVVLQGTQNQTPSETDKQYKPVRIGQGRRSLSSDDRIFRSSNGATIETVALLVQKKGYYYERMGLTAVESNLFNGNLQWIDLA
jgi:hypothetical protein